MYRTLGAVFLLIVGVLIVVWAARGHLHREQPDSMEPVAEVSHTEHVGEPMERAQFSLEERKFLLTLARRTVEEVVSSGNLPEVDATGLSNRLTEPRACFVTLKKKGELRGCIGHIFPREPLYRAVVDNARSAAVEDYRFPAVREEELQDIEIEVSVLTVPKPLDFDSPDDLLRKLRSQEDGVVLRIGQRQATFLPQVWEQLPDKETFLAHLSVKAGCPALAWRNPGTSVLTYRAEAFKESEL